jgi:hypothetical protein
MDQEKNGRNSKYSDLKDSVVFLDLTLSNNKQGIIETNTFIKLNNLHFYIPATSAHPPY